MCCKSGSVTLPDFWEPPDSLKTLFDGNTPEAQNFWENIWKYNHAFAFTSMKVTEDHSVNHGNGPPVFRIQGELFHRIGPLEPASQNLQSYSQLYFYDPQAAFDHWRRCNAGLNPSTLRTLHEILYEYHQYVHAYRYAYEVLQHYDPHEDISIRLRVTPAHDRQRYNLPTADEVAVILPQVPTSDNTRDIVLYQCSGGLRIISDTVSV